MIIHRTQLMALPLWALLFAPLVGCEEQSTSPASAPQGVAAQAAGESVQTGPGLPEEYIPFKSAATTLAQESRNWAPDFVSLARSERRFDLADCGIPLPDVEPVKMSPKEQGYSDLSHRIAYFSELLQAVGFPSDVYKPALDTHELSEARRIESGADPNQDDPEAAAGRLKALATDLNDRRDAARLDLPLVVVQGECGDGEDPVYVRANPPGGRVWFATRFSFLLCQARNLDPWDRNGCGRWTELDPGRVAELSGSYMYQAKWPDGSTGRGQKNVDGNGDGVRSEDDYAIVWIQSD